MILKLVVKKCGGSKMIILPWHIVKELGLEEFDVLEAEINKNIIILKKEIK